MELPTLKECAAERKSVIKKRNETQTPRKTKLGEGKKEKKFLLLRRNLSCFRDAVAEMESILFVFKFNVWLADFGHESEIEYDPFRSMNGYKMKLRFMCGSAKMIGGIFLTTSTHNQFKFYMNQSHCILENEMQIIGW